MSSTATFYTPNLQMPNIGAGAFEQVSGQLRAQSGDAELTQRMEQRAQSRFDLLAYSAGSRLCHGDFQQGNVLAAANKAGNWCAFDNARAGGLISRRPWLQHEDRRSREPPLAGYGEFNHPDPAEAVWLCVFRSFGVAASHASWRRTSEGPAGLRRTLDEVGL
jgi:Ser/Thr protein kinase RdoA (MazF antagonist)